jgi:signal transduction histidine kinase
VQNSLQNQVLAHRARFEKAYRIIRPDNGQERWVYALGELGYTAEGQPVEMIGTIQDITERKHAEIALQESLSRLQATLESTADGILVVDRSGRITSYNRRFVELWRLPENVLATKADEAALAFVLQQLKNPEAFLAKVRELYARPEADSFDLLEFNDGRVFERYSRPQLVESRAMGRVWSFRDVTDRKRNEEELQRKNEELERFTYTVSHDLKSPLITIKGFTGALQQDLAAGRHERLEGDLQRIADATDKMTELLNDLLELSRIGRIMNPPSDVALEELIREVLELLAGPLRERGVEVALHPHLPVVRGDRRRLLEVFQNLIENAVRFMGDQPRPRIEIGLRDVGAERVFFVRDNGIGIEPRYQETVFGLFNKLDARTSGTGIGLALVRRIIAVHGGRIWVESRGQGQGSSFCFTLPPMTPPRMAERL